MGWFLSLLFKKAGKDHIFISVKKKNLKMFCKIGPFIIHWGKCLILNIYSSHTQIRVMFPERRSKRKGDMNGSLNHEWMSNTEKLWNAVYVCQVLLYLLAWQYQCFFLFLFTISVLFLCWDLAEQKKTWEMFGIMFICIL